MVATQQGGMGKMTYSVSGVPELQAKFAAAPAKIRIKIMADLNKYGVVLASALRAKAPKDQGNLRAGIHSDPMLAAGDLAVITIRGSASYTMAVDKGTAPHFPPSAALVGWATRHPMAGVSPQQSAFLIARAISKRGTRAQDFIDPVLLPAEREVASVINKSLGQVTL
jgi:hypothetical protein